MSFHDPQLATTAPEPAGRWQILVYTTTGGPFRGCRCFDTFRQAEAAMQRTVWWLNHEGPDCVVRSLDGKIRWGDFSHYRIERVADG